MSTPAREPPSTRGAAALVAMAAACLASSCGPVPGLVSRLERDRSCPAHRIVVKPRPDLRQHHFACMKQPTWRAVRQSGKSWVDTDRHWVVHPSAIDLDCTSPDPPPGIRDDPGRVRMWQDQRARRFDEIDLCFGVIAPCTVAIVDVEACGTRSFYACDQDWCSDLGPDEPARSP